MNILISRLSALGDCVCTLPVAVALKKSFPESRITWAVDPRFAGIIECCPSVDDVQRVKPGFKPASWPTFSEKFELALDMQGLSKSGLVVARAKSAKKLGYHWQRELAPLFSSAVKPDPSSLHVVDQYVDVARAAGAECDRADFGMVPHEADREKCKELLAEHGVKGPFVALNAGAGWASKRWPAIHFSRLSDMISAKGIAPVFIGGKAEGDLAAFREVEQEAKSPIVNLLGKTSVRELVSLISLANAHVGGDTGSSHVAAGLGVPAIGLYSITKPARSCPYGQIHRCHYEESGLKDIQPESVFSNRMGGSILTLEALQEAREGKTVVFTNGVFDILHAGHVDYLEKARDLGDYLVVALNADETVRKLKGTTRPVNTLEDRQRVIGALRCVDCVVSFSEQTPEEIIRQIRPDIHVKGGDYTENSLPEAKIVKSYGGRIVIMPTLEGRSTTSIIERMQK